MSREVSRSRRLAQRSSRTVPASIVAVVLLAVGALAALVAVLRLVDGTWPSQVTGPASAVAALTWGSTVVLAAGAVVVLLGLVLLVAGLKPGPVRSAPLRSSGSGPVEDTDFVISSRALARLAAARADLVDGVDSVAASATARHVHLRVTTASAQAEQIRSRVDAGVTAALTDAGVQPVPRVTTVVRTKGL